MLEPRSVGPILIPAVMLVLALVGTRATGQAPERGAFPIDVAYARACFDEARALSDADGGALWGKAMYGPMLLVDAASRATVANVRDRAGVLVPGPHDTFTGTLPDTVPLGNTTVRWSGVQWSMILWPPPSDATWRGTLLMHECFHRVQHEIGLPLTAPANHHLDDEHGRVWLRLEMRALATALAADEPLADPALDDALRFRAFRRARVRIAAREERELELNEGVAEYTGLRLGGATPAQQRARAIAGLHGHDGAGSLVRTFAYATGAAYGLLLDAADEGWRSRVDETTDLARLLERATGRRVPRRPDEEDVLDRAARHGHDEVAEAERDRAVLRVARTAELRARYVDGPRLVVALTGDVQYSFTPHAIEALDGEGTFYGSIRLSGPFGVLDAPGGALIVERRRGRRHACVPAPVDPDPLVPAGEGWTMTLAAGWALVPHGKHGDYRVEPVR